MGGVVPNLHTVKSFVIKPMIMKYSNADCSESYDELLSRDSALLEISTIILLASRVMSTGSDTFLITRPLAIKDIECH